MDQSRKNPSPASEHRPAIVSPYMLTQLNETICGCRCGCGCGCAGHGDNNYYDRMSDGESGTAVDLNESDDGGGFPLGRQMQEDGIDDNSSYFTDDEILSPHAVSYQSRRWLLEDVEGLQAGETMEDWELYNDLEDAADSLFNEAPKTESRSNAISEHGSPRKLSPGPGIGALFVSDGTEHVELVYYFDVRPLRLSAEYEHARGQAKEHLLIPDENSFENMGR